MVCEVLKRKIRVNVVDVYAVPDYVNLLSGCVDPAVARFSKEEWAQLQFTFESVKMCEKYPTGVKTTYRAYTQDSFIEIVEEDKKQNGQAQSICGLIPQECKVRPRPLPGEPVLNVLVKLPTADILPAAFIAGSREIIEAVSMRMISQYAKNRPSVAEEWSNWSTKVAPISDNVQDYLTTHSGVVVATSFGTTFKLETEDNEINEADAEGGGGLYIPFRKRMFSESGMSEYHVDPRLRGVRDQTRTSRSAESMRVVESTSCVLHQDHKNATARRIGSRDVLLDENGQVPSEPKTVLNGVYPGREERRTGAAIRRREAKEAKEEAKRSANNMTLLANSSLSPSHGSSVSAHVLNSTSVIAEEKSSTKHCEDKVVTSEEPASIVDVDANVVQKKLIKRKGASKKKRTNVDAKQEVTTIINEKPSKKRKMPVKKSRGGTVEIVPVTEPWKDNSALNVANVLSCKRKPTGPSAKYR